jgi:hypothetical protein
MKRYSARTGGVVTALGGLLWIALRYFVTFSWGNSMLGLDYWGWNSLMPIPLLLLLLGVAGLYARHNGGIGRLGRAGLLVMAIGLVGASTGVIVEFWWAGGLAGNRAGAHLGWALYVVSYVLILTSGLWLFGIALSRSARLRAWSLVPLLMGALSLSWPPVIAAGTAWQSMWVQALFGIGWMLLGFCS